MTPLILYRQQAAKEQDAADTAVLENVRDRSRRAAEAWTKLASQIERADELRAARNMAVDAGENSREPSENPARERAAISLEVVGSTQLVVGYEGDRSGS
jgi:hypothetical protein